MSISVEYFFNSHLDFATLTEAFVVKLGLPFLPYEGNRAEQFCRLLGIELSLSSDHQLENDRDCNFSDYRFELSSRTPVPDSDLRSMQIEMMAILAYAMHCRLDLQEGMLTFDLQTVLARYSVADDEWIDDITATTVSFPKHLADLRTRVSRDGWVN